MAKIEYITKRTGARVPFSKERITNAIYRAAVAVGGRDRTIADGLADQAVAILEAQAQPGEAPTVEQIQDVVETVLIKNGYARTAKAYILYRNERTRRREEQARRWARTDDFYPWRTMWEGLDWAVAHDVHTVERLNARIARGEFADLVREADQAYEEDIALAAEMVRQREEPVRVVVIAGPSSSGKTTTTIKFGHLLQQQGLHLVPLTVDHYFHDLEMHPKDEHGDYDYETPQALDLALINEHLQRLLAGEEVCIPSYDFRTGRQRPDHTPMRIGPHDVILIDSLHGLYAEMTASVDDEAKFRLYIEPLLQCKGPDGEYVRYTDLRLMRRMERDSKYRAYDPTRTLEHWHYVRSSELRNIIAYIHTADYVVNSGLPYELPVMRTRLLDSFARWVEQYRDDPLRHDAFERAERVHRLLQAVTPVTDESAIPPDSLLREFIGGSCYQY
ncbi:MAG: ATP cone domain-containing protein [Chloroflexota bacterium]